MSEFVMMFPNARFNRLKISMDEVVVLDLDFQAFTLITTIFSGSSSSNNDDSNNER